MPQRQLGNLLAERAPRTGPAYVLRANPQEIRLHYADDDECENCGDGHHRCAPHRCDGLTDEQLTLAAERVLDRDNGLDSGIADTFDWIVTVARDRASRDVAGDHAGVVSAITSVPVSGTCPPVSGGDRGNAQQPSGGAALAGELREDLVPAGHLQDGDIFQSPRRRALVRVRGCAAVVRDAWRSTPPPAATRTTRRP
jgi:hypothetical protein